MFRSLFDIGQVKIYLFCISKNLCYVYFGREYNNNDFKILNCGFVNLVCI